MNGVWENVKQRPLTWIWRLAGIVLAVRLLALDVPLSGILTNGLFLAFAVWLLLTLSAPAWRGAFCWLSRGRYLTGSEANPLVSGATGLVVVLLLGLPLPLMFTVDGETLDSRKALGTQILDILQLRHLDLQEGILLAKPARPETIADLCSTDPAKREAAQRSIERINLQGRSLRRANLYRTLMPLADLRNAKLQGAELFDARLQGADLKSASLYTKWLPLTTALVDVRGLKWQPLGTKEIEQLKKVVNNWSRERPNLSFFKRLDDASAAAKFKPPTFESCLLDTNTEVKCKKSYSIYEFRIKLFEELVALACQSSDFSHGIVLRISRGSDIRDFTTEGLAIRLLDIRKKNVNKDSCPGLFALTADDTAQLARLAQQENR